MHLVKIAEIHVYWQKKKARVQLYAKVSGQAGGLECNIHRVLEDHLKARYR